MTTFRFLLTAIFYIGLSPFIHAQSTSTQKMQQLHFMVGEWIGTSTGITHGKITREEPAYEQITYGLDSSILVINLRSKSLVLHTIIYYDETKECYFYYPFSKNGVRGIRATFENGSLIVHSSDTRRYVFAPLPNGGFTEYGENLVNGQWEKYFEDTFTNTQ